jgi:serine protease Do
MAPFFGNEFFGQFFGVPSEPKTRKEASLGSGFIINRDGYIVTNNHVVARADEIKVIFYDETEAIAKLVGKDSKTDVALLKVDRLPEKLEPVILGDSDEMKVGEIVVAIGNPFGLSHSVTQGIISAKERAIGLGPYDDFIQTDASINPGNSGGPLLNLYAEVIGINSAMHAGGQGIGFAIPINSAKDVIKKLKKDGKVVRSQLGVQVQKLNDDHVKALKLKNKDGALVSQVIEGSAAEKAGIKAGDVIVGIDDKKIKDWHTLPLMVSSLPVGKRVKIDLIRNSTLKTIVVQVSELKDESAEESKTEQKIQKEDPLGLTIQNMTKEVAQSLGLGISQKGVLITAVKSDSKAASKGVHRGDVIVEVNRKNIDTVDQYNAVVQNFKKGDSVLLLIVRKQGTIFIAFEL